MAASPLRLDSSMPNFQRLDGIRNLAEKGRFKTWLLDQFGVLHDGKNPYPGAISTLEKLAGSGAKMVIISNSSRRASTTLEKMNTLGFDTSLFAGAITSGELTHQYLERRDDPWFASLGRSCIHFTWLDRGAISLEGLNLEVVTDPESADFVLAHGTEALGHVSGGSHPMDLHAMESVLKLCAKKGIPMVVANPDFVTVEARNLRVMPGTLGAKYEELGGQVRWMGKPDKLIYEAAMAAAGAAAIPGDCITVGDSLHHDIKGANSAGMASALICGGIHADELGDPIDYVKVNALTAKVNAFPSFVLPSFIW